MEKKLLIHSFIKTVLGVALITGPVTSHAQWKKLTSIISPGTGGGRWGAMAFTVNNKIYVAGGYSNTKWFNDVAEYDISTDKWKAKNDLPGSSKNRSAGVSFVINGKAYMGLGAENHLSFTTDTPRKLKDLWEYDAATDKWKQMNDLPDTGRTDASVFIINNKAYIVGGQTTRQGAATNDVWEFNPAANKWTAKSHFIGYPEMYASATFVANGKGYLTGGINGYDPATYEYDATADKWNKKSDFPDSARLGAVGFSHNNKGYVGLGNKKGGYQTTFYTYNPQNDRWSFVNGSFPGAARSFARAEVVNGKAYIGAGWKLDGQQYYFDDWYELDISAMLGVENTEKELSASVYPNPATSDLFVNIGGNYNQCNFSLYQVTGQKIKNGALAHNGRIDVSTLPAGQYIIELVTEEQSSRQIFSINR